MLSLGRAYYLLGEEKPAREEFESLRTYYEEKIEEVPETGKFHSALGRVYAYLGLKEKAIKEGKKGIFLQPVSKDGWWGPIRVYELAVIYNLTGEHELAIDKLEYLLSTPSFYTKWDLKLNPLFDPLRDNPRFQKLVTEG